MRRALLLLVVLLAGCGEDDGDNGATAAGGESVRISGTDFELDPADVTVDAAGRTTFTFTNDGQTEHALEIEGEGVEEETETIGPGESAELTVQLDAGEYELYCPVSNHRDLGMEGRLVVGGEGGAADGGTTTEKSEDGGYYGG